MAANTPMQKQYQEIKAQYPDALLFFRLGDFYELFGEDAHIAARELEITLTAREAGQGERVPMCGVPYHAVDSYLAQLVQKGYKVAICEQMEDPRLARGVVRREVIRVVTPGTVLDPKALEATSHNYLVAVLFQEKGAGLAVADLSTGEFLATELTGAGAEKGLREELVRLAPRECLIPQGWTPPSWLQACLGDGVITSWEAEYFRQARAYTTLTAHFRTQSLRGFGCEELPLATGAAGALLAYLQETQKGEVAGITGLTVYSTASYMTLDPATRRNLELTRSLSGDKRHSLAGILDRTVTALGGRLLRSWVEQPLLDRQAILARHTAVAEFVADGLWRDDLRRSLAGVADLERLLSRVVYGAANARELLSLGESLAALPRTRELLERAKAPRLVALREELAAAMTAWGDLPTRLRRALVDNPPLSVREGGLIRPGYNEEVDRLRSLAGSGKDWIAALEARERERTGIKSLKVGYNRVFGYYIEVTKPNLSLVPSDYTRRQTLANAERFITPELKEYEEQVLGAEEKLITLEYEIFVALRGEVTAVTGAIQAAARVVAELDVLASFAEVAVNYDYVQPELEDSTRLEIREGRHPVVERTLAGGAFVPNDTDLDTEERRLLILTGPNMAGKSTYGRQVALIVLMAQIGSFVPARSARIGLVDRIFTRVGAADDLATGQSTFMVEMTEVANILHNATARSLIILDEVGRGTSTFDGLAIAWAVSEYIADPAHIGARTIFATHYHELIALEGRVPGVKNYCVAVEERAEEVIFLHKIIPGGTDQSYGIEVARLAGLPAPVLARARAILSRLEAENRTGGLVAVSREEGEGTKKGKEGREPGQDRGKDGEDTPTQLSLFLSPQEELLARLRQVEIEQLTPLAALNLLAELAAAARRLG